MKKLVIRDSAGSVINIGPWDYCPRTEQRLGADDVLEDVEVDTNPFPEGATQSEEEVVVRADGGFAVVTDHTSLRQPEYPPIVDQLDALWKGGAAADEMRARILAVKARHPKAAP